MDEKGEMILGPKQNSDPGGGGGDPAKKSFFLT
jgi:hypothetical protein